MPDDVYRSLAKRLDEIPNGFPASESGVELRLLAKIFTPQEAALAATMRLTPEPAADIAARADADPAGARRTLKEMVRKGLIRVERKPGHLAFALIPFVFGIYEFQLPRLDAEMAQLFEQYLQETQGGSIIRESPPIHRVVPVDEAIPVDLDILPCQQAAELVDRARSWGVRDCICRVQQKLVGKGCNHTVENCLAFLPVAGAFANSQDTRAISKKDALHILRDAAQEGLVHSTSNYRNGNFYICNCCTCCCGILRGVAEFGVPTAIAHSDFHAVEEREDCVGCGECAEHCPFDALAVTDGTCVVDLARCMGCGVCVSACPEDALSLRRRPETETPLTPADEEEWMTRRAEERGIPLDKIV